MVFYLICSVREWKNKADEYIFWYLYPQRKTEIIPSDRDELTDLNTLHPRRLHEFTWPYHIFMGSLTKPVKPLELSDPKSSCQWYCDEICWCNIMSQRYVTLSANILTGRYVHIVSALLMMLDNMSPQLSKLLAYRRVGSILNRWKSCHWQQTLVPLLRFVKCSGLLQFAVITTTQLSSYIVAAYIKCVFSSRKSDQVEVRRQLKVNRELYPF